MLKIKRAPKLRKDKLGEYYEVEMANKKGVTLIDKADWPLFAGNFYRSVDGYACRHVRVAGRRTKQAYLHKQIMPHDGPVDHIDGNYANNRRHNLRKCTASQNQWNRKKSKNGSSRFKGVAYIAHKKDEKKWKAVCWQFGESNFLGYFKTERAAAKAYDIEAKKRFGEFARCNL